MNYDKFANVKYDEIIEVSKKEYEFLMQKFSGLLAFRKTEHNFYVKVWQVTYFKIKIEAEKNRGITINSEK